MLTPLHTVLTATVEAFSFGVPSIDPARLKVMPEATIDPHLSPCEVEL